MIKDILENIMVFFVYLITVFLVAIGLAFLSDGFFAYIDETTCRDIVVTSININLKDNIQTYTATDKSDDLLFESIRELHVGDTVTVCNYDTPLHFATVSPYIYLKVTK